MPAAYSIGMPRCCGPYMSLGLFDGFVESYTFGAGTCESCILQGQAIVCISGHTLPGWALPPPLGIFETDICSPEHACHAFLQCITS